MINITNLNNAVLIDMGEGNKQYTLPKSTIIATQSDNSDMVNIKYKACRKTIISINYKEVNTPLTNSSKELITALNAIFY